MKLNRKMPVNAAEEAIIAHRREMVARARLRGASLREIVDGLAKAKHVNPTTGDPWSLGTIHRDIKTLQLEWRREAKKTVDHHKSRQLAELQEARRQAWHDNDIQSVLRAISQEMTLLGTEAPKVSEVKSEIDLNVDDATERLFGRIDSLAARIRKGGDVGGSGTYQEGEGSS